MYRFVAFAITVIVATASSAFAADLPVKAGPAPVAAPVYSWTGFYIGANIGGGWGDRDVNTVANDPLAVLTFNSLSGGPPPISFTSTTRLTTSGTRS